MVIDNIILPLFNYNLSVGMAIVALIATLFSTVVYKYTTDQLLLKRIKRETKELQEKSKSFKDNQEKLMQINKEIMSKSFEQMKITFKSSMYTMLPLLIVFIYLAGNFTYEPIKPNEQFELNIYSNNKSIEYQLPKKIKLIEVNNIEEDKNYITNLKLISNNTGLVIIPIENTKHRILISDKIEYEDPIQEISNSKITKIETVHKELTFINLFGWEIGYLGTYIIFSIIFSIILRKLLNVQ
ncbi:DUF106 domain-containing protein [Candidatus Woesearchaeota archaeon]|jgi:uncharacterized membrane protein (DUF106 family)|nr:DUF106 domain-containing protein [Candidatus Woesearchaeota archaeon]MBT4387729.1 DUF106 domain-containing protein [Candidatus Woesearchaeota archaeon]MBT4595548.1 DUF106 domain-containing protein [Candidatus Woesearchaeota archaeon]MBT5740969.1 DUF106 domain-containing protein [Candidatus Woesearchaeota archaeon]MBT6505786.1 DUF106 domain-containing protein [Candidatus Woesearchaeota archaeon]